MKNLYLTVLCLTAVICAGTETNKSEEVRVSLALKDGSILIGVATQDSFSLHTSMGILKIPMERIRSIRVGEETVAQMLFKNEDILTGAIEDETFKIDTILGRQDVPIKVVKNVVFLSGNENLEDGLLAYYPLNGNARDTSGNGHNGNAHDAAWTKDRFGRPDSAVFFDKNNPKRIEVSGINLTRTSFSISAWTKRTGTAGEDYIFGLGTHQAANLALHFGYAIVSGEKCMRLSFYGEPLDTTLGNYDQSEWHLWVVTYDASNRKRTIYRDGVPVASGASSSDFLGTGTFYIGKIGFSSVAFDGAIDDVRVYNRALSAVEVRQIYGMNVIENAAAAKRDQSLE